MKGNGWEYIPAADEKESLVFRTHDLGISAALLCLNYKLLDINKTSPRKAMFIFSREDGIENAADQYFTDQLEVKARAYFDHLRALKNMLYND